MNTLVMGGMRWVPTCTHMVNLQLQNYTYLIQTPTHRAEKKNVRFPVTEAKNLGSVGIFFFFNNELQM